jgi:hypothetical protein
MVTGRLRHRASLSGRLTHLIDAAFEGHDGIEVTAPALAGGLGEPAAIYVPALSD